MKFRQPPEVPKRNVLLYGPPKTSKTRGATSAPGPVLLLNADLPNATWYAHSQASNGQIHELEYEDFRTVVELGQEANRGGFDDFETIVVDPIGELYRLVLEELSGGVVSASLPTYLATQVHIERLCRSLCKCQTVNAVFVCHEFPVKDEASDTFERLPYTGTTNPALGQKLMAMVDVIGFTGVIEREGQEPEYSAQLLSGRGRRGGDRFDVLGRNRPLDLSEWFDLMTEKTTKKESVNDKRSKQRQPVRNGASVGAER